MDPLFSSDVWFHPVRRGPCGLQSACQWLCTQTLTLVCLGGGSDTGGALVGWTQRIMTHWVGLFPQPLAPRFTGLWHHVRGLCSQIWHHLRQGSGQRIQGQQLRSEELAQGFNGLGVRNVMVGVFSSIEQEKQLASRARWFGNLSSFSFSSGSWLFKNEATIKINALG